jgi:hypothetical protein
MQATLATTNVISGLVPWNFTKLPSVVIVLPWPRQNTKISNMECRSNDAIKRKDVIPEVIGLGRLHTQDLLL